MAAAPKAEPMDVEAPARPSPIASDTKHRSPHDLLAETRASIEKVAARMLAIKRDGVPKSELRELVTQMSLLLVTLRQVNREILMEEDRVKAETEAAKAPVDSTTLQLHNLLYEKNHYVKAIRACLDFQTKYPGIELVPEEEFQRAAPADIRDKTLAADACHDLMLKRLNFELVQRKELCKLHEKLELQRGSLLGTIANQKKFLSSLPSHLKSLKKASLPVQQQLGMQHTKKLKQHHAAELLPTPLYITYTQLLGQKEAFGENIEVEIMGSTKDVQIFAQQQAKKENGTLSSGENNRMDDDVIDDDEDAQRRRSRSKKNVMKEANNPAVAYQLHPLKVIVHIYDTEDSGIKRRKLTTLRFEYLAKLNVVCVGIEESEGLDSNILCNLFPDDTGLELPHQMAKIYAGEPPNFSDKNSRPYKWAQHLAGVAANSVDSDFERRSVTNWEETESAREDGELPVVIHAENEPNSSGILPSEMSPEVRSHSRGLSLISKSVTPSKLSISHSFGRNEDDLDLLMYSDSELEDHPVIHEETEKGNLIIDKSWEDYASKEFTMVLSKAMKNGPKVMLEAKVKISMEYPLRPPLFGLRLLSDKSETLKWHNDLRAMESEVNLHILRSLPSSCEDYILAHQVMCLAMLFDMHFDEDYEKRKVTSVIDVGLCKPSE
nr:unnamed protein product [Digitaria exilis]